MTICWYNFFSSKAMTLLRDKIFFLKPNSINNIDIVKLNTLSRILTQNFEDV